MHSTLTYDVTATLAYDIDSSFADAQNQLTDAVNILEDILSHTNDATEPIHEIAMELRSELKTARYPVPRLDAYPNEGLEAVKTYKTLAAAARSELPVLKAENDLNAAKAKDAAKAGEAVLRHAQTLVRCD